MNKTSFLLVPIGPKPLLWEKSPMGSYRVLIKYCVFFEDFKIFRTLSFLCFPSVSVCVHTRQVENQRCKELAEFGKITTF